MTLSLVVWKNEPLVITCEFPVISYLFWVWGKYHQLNNNNKKKFCCHRQRKSQKHSTCARQWCTVEKCSKESAWLESSSPWFQCVPMFAETKATQSGFAAELLVRPQLTLAINPQKVSIADCFRLFVVHALFCQDVVWLLCQRLVEILNGYHSSEHLESQAIRMSQRVLRKWKQSLKVSLLYVIAKREWRERGQCHLRRTQYMGLALKYSMDPSTEWERDNVDGPQPPPSHDNQSRGDLNERCFLFCPSHIQSARFCNLCLQLLGQRKWMVSEKRKAYSGLKRLARSYISQTWASWQQLPASSVATCSNPQGPSIYPRPTWRADIKEWFGGKALPSSNLSLFPALSVLLRCNNRTHLIKWLIDYNWFYIKSRGWQWEAQSSWLNSFTFNSLL